MVVYVVVSGTEYECKNNEGIFENESDALRYIEEYITNPENSYKYVKTNDRCWEDEMYGKYIEIQPERLQ